MRSSLFNIERVMCLAMHFMLLLSALSTPAHSQNVNVCSKDFICSSDIDCQNVGNRFGEKWACQEARCVEVQCLIELDCVSSSSPSTSKTIPNVCVENRCQAPKLASSGESCDVTAGY